MTTLRWPAKDPDEVLDYTHNWAPRGLTNDEIVSTTADVTTGNCVVDDHGITSGNNLSTTTWLSGGTNGTACTITLEAVTDDGRTLQEVVHIAIASKA